MSSKVSFCLVYVSVFVALSAAGFAAHRFTGHTTASSEKYDNIAQNAIDGNVKTRWNSLHTDDAWWQIAFAEPEDLAGLQIVWEAHGEHYAIQVSDDGRQWHTVFEETAGDGNTDWIFFRPVTTRFLRLQGRQRGTGWGYAIREISPLHPHEWPKVEAGNTLAGNPPHHVMDGQPETYWRSATAAPTEVVITLARPIELGGLDIRWGAEFATSYAVELQTADGQWQRVAHVSQGNGRQDVVYFSAIQATRIKLLLERSNRGRGYAIGAVRLKDGAAQPTPLPWYQAVAKARPRGWYPQWLYREQEFWTITGVPGDTAESLLGESGTFEPYKNGFTVMPFVHTGGHLFSWADVEVEQALEAGSLPLPRVTWQTENWSLDIASVSFGDAGASRTAVRYRLTNRSTQAISGRLVLAMRPLQLNPKWQRGGFSPLQTLEVMPAGAGRVVRLNGQERIHAPAAPSQVVALAWDQGQATVLDCLQTQTCAPGTRVTDEAGKSEAALVYDFSLAPGDETDVVLLFPLHGQAPETSAWQDAAAAFKQHWQEQRQYWQALLDRVAITIPEPRLIDILKSNLAYILLNQDGPWIMPGPRNYSHSWLRDGAMTSLALLRLGITEPVRRYLQAYWPLVDAKGWTPWIIFDGKTPVAFATDSREGHEYDSQGQFPFLVRQYTDFTGDTAMLEDTYAVVVRALRYGQFLRQERMGEPYRSQPQWAAYYGILPESNSHEGYYPAQHSYWDDFWYLRGLKDGIALAERLGKEADARWMQAELDDARRALYASMRRVIERDNLNYLPGSVEKGDFDATSTAIAIMVSDEAEHLPQPYATNTFERYYQELLSRPATTPRSYTPYEIRTADAFVRLGQRQRALHMLRTFTNDVRPPAWNHLAEVVHEPPRAPSYIGDMPHTWVGSSYISAVRSLFVYEENDGLILAAGIAPAWVRDGISVHHLPTPYGSINYEIAETEGLIRMQIWGEADPPGGFMLRLPREWHGRVTRLNGEAVANVGAAFRVATLPATLELQARP